MEPSRKQRLWGWYFFDWASQPFYTLGLTFIFAPYFAEVARNVYEASGSATPEAAAQSLWFRGQTIAGLFIALTAPFLGAWADSAGRKMPWIILFSVIYLAASWALWGLTPDGGTLLRTLVLFFIGFIAAESALNFINAYLPSMGDDHEIGSISGTGAAFGYWGGVGALLIMLALLAENADGVTLLGQAPLFGLDPEGREGTRSVGPFIAIWYAVFMVPFFLWVRDDPAHRPVNGLGLRKAVAGLGETLRGVGRRVSLRSFLIGSMLYRDGLNALYAAGGIYAKLVLDWSIIQIGVFGILGAVTAAIVTWAAGLADARFGPKPVIRVAIWALIGVGTIIIGMSRTQIFGIPLGEGSALPDILFYICGAAIGGAGGALYASSRSLMVRHTDPDRPTEAFGLFALSGKATAFIAPLLIGWATIATGSNQLGFVPVIFLFGLGLFMLRWVNPDGDRAEWSEKS